MSFKLYFGKSPCDPTDLFHEGVEVSVGNWDKRGHWIPLQYLARTGNELGNNIGTINKEEHTVGIRGYSVPYQIHNRRPPLSVRLSVCGGVLQDGLQFRWLQTTVLLNTEKHRDVVALDNVSISLAFGNNTPKLLIDEEFNSLNVERYISPSWRHTKQFQWSRNQDPFKLKKHSPRYRCFFFTQIITMDGIGCSKIPFHRTPWPLTHHTFKYTEYDYIPTMYT